MTPTQADADLFSELRPIVEARRAGYRRAIRQVIRHLRRARGRRENEKQIRDAFDYYRAGIAACDRLLSRFAGLEPPRALGTRNLEPPR